MTIIILIMSKNYFEGYYFKHQKDGQTIAFIPGKAQNSAFIQVITNERSYNFNFNKIKIGPVAKGEEINVGGCSFSVKGIKIELPNIRGEIKYTEITPLRSDIMGPFRFLPMECRHGILSMHHKLSGKLKIDGTIFDFTGGTGYIEKDSGISFPKNYLWLQCCSLTNKFSIMLSVARIPFCGMEFWGCICAVIYKANEFSPVTKRAESDRDFIEFRLATYKGVKIIKADDNNIVLRQGIYRLEIDIKNGSLQPLFAPQNGEMTQIIRESNKAMARFRFFEGNKLLFDLFNENVSFEYHM